MSLTKIKVTSVKDGTPPSLYTLEDKAGKVKKTQKVQAESKSWHGSCETPEVIPFEETTSLERRQRAASSSEFHLGTSKKYFSSMHEVVGRSMSWPLQAQRLVTIFSRLHFQWIAYNKQPCTMCLCVQSPVNNYLSPLSRPSGHTARVLRPAELAHEQSQPSGKHANPQSTSISSLD